MNTMQRPVSVMGWQSWQGYQRRKAMKQAVRHYLPWAVVFALGVLTGMAVSL